MIKQSRASLARILAAALFTAMPLQQGHSAPGVLPAAPLYLSTIVEPNVYFTLDDSGSMDFETMMRADTGLSTFNGALAVDGQWRAYYSPNFSLLYPTWFFVLPPANGTDAQWDMGWVGRNHLANPNYYNPSVTYKPWAGTNADGTPMYEDAVPTAALKHPDFPTGEKVNLEINHTFTEGIKTTTEFWIPTYHVWSDSDSDGVVEYTDANTRVEIAAGSAEMQNFANWFQYHRSRINVTKSVIGDTINNTDASRMGSSMINFGPLDDIATMSDAANKRDQLDKLYAFVITPNPTPLRSALRDAGDYFMVDDGTGPILPAADGGECQQNFNILMTDGFWNGSLNPGVGNRDADGGSNANDTIFDGDKDQSNDGGNYADGVSNTLADVAMRNYETDLRGDLDDKVPIQATVDEATHQHLVTFTVGFGVNGSINPPTDPLAEGFVWPTPVADANTTIDDLWHAAYNGRGKFLNAQSPEQLRASLSAAITNISERTDTAAAVAINSARLSTESVVYLAQFNPNRWQGNLLAFPIIDLDTGELAATPKWDAASNLNGRDFSANPRKVFTYNKSLATPDGVPFQWANLSTDMKNDLKTNAIGGTDPDTTGEARLDYLRGDRSNEGTGLFFRERLSLLGDLVNSGPVFVGEPSLNWPDQTPFPTGAQAYSEYKNGTYKNRKKVVYAGANDGMLHGFADSDGQEIFAYVPEMFASSNVGEGLHHMTEPNYVHRFYVDETPTLSDVHISSGSTTEWHTVLIGAVRSGARGLFALNVTDPALYANEANAAKIALWEFTNADDIDLGYTFSRPFVGLTNSGKWVAIFGNGYNDLGSGEAQLFIVDIEAGATDGTWTTGDYWKITTGVGDASNRNGLATPQPVDVDGDGTVDRVYAGDLQGNLWAFDLSSNNASQWSVAYKSGSTPVPLFSTPAGQPITSKPVMARHPTQPDSGSPSNAPNLMVYFGTGQYLVDADKTSTGTQSFYGVWDTGDDALSQADLIEQTFETGFSGRVLSRNALDYSVDHGWFFDLPDTGERSVVSPIARGDTVFFNSFVPVDDPCSVGGYGFKFAVDMATGGSPLEPTYDSNGDGVINEYDTVSDGTKSSTLAAVRQEGYLPEPVFIEDLAFTAETATKVKKLKDVPSGRFSWQELIQ